MNNESSCNYKNRKLSYLNEVQKNNFQFLYGAFLEKLQKVLQNYLQSRLI